MRTSKVGSVLSAIVSAALVVLLVPTTALAGKPKGEYAVFNDCPLATAGVTECVYAQFSSGELALGSLRVPIAHTITLQGGLIVVGASETFVNPTEGQTLSPTAQEVPGGLIGLPGHGSESTAFSIAMELAGSVALSRVNLAGETGTALKLPVRVHLKNVFLGEVCYIGSATAPVVLNLTTGATSPPKPNLPIHGTAGEAESKEGGNLLVYKNDSLVDNSFSSPTPKGCGGIQESLIVPVLDSKYGWPASSGHDTAILTGTSKFASAEAVKASE